jgi:hypothetical protein
MGAECLAAIHLCRIRVTRLDSTGHPIAGPNNVYVSDKPISLGVTPVIEAGQDRTLVGGCDCIVATYRGYDKLKRFDFQLDLGKLEPGLLEMLTGSAAILSGGFPIGNWFDDQQFLCSGPPSPNVCVEAWQDAWADDHQDPTFPYVHWIWPSTYWQIGPQTLQNDFAQPRLTGFSRGNSVWGTGIYGDLPEAAQPLGGYFYAASIPAAGCGYQSHAIT